MSAEWLRAEERCERRETLAEWPVRIVSYRMGDDYVCVVDNVDPGANVARGRGPTREDAEEEAVSKATRRLERTGRPRPGS